MNVIYVKQVPPIGLTLTYQIDGEMITATVGGVNDTFDFSNFPDGEVDFHEIDTTLPIQPVIRAERTNGSLTVTLLDWGEGNG